MDAFVLIPVSKSEMIAVKQTKGQPAVAVDGYDCGAVKLVFDGCTHELKPDLKVDPDAIEYTLFLVPNKYIQEIEKEHPDAIVVRDGDGFVELPDCYNFPITSTGIKGNFGFVRSRKAMETQAMEMKP